MMAKDIKNFADRGGPGPGIRWLTPSEYTSAQDLAVKVGSGLRFEGVSLWSDLPSPSWRVLEVPCPGRPDHKILIGLPPIDRPSGRAATVAFFMVVAPATDEKHTQESLVDLAKQARVGIERLLAGLIWTWDEALARAIDRCLVLEEEKRTDANR